MKGLTRVLTIEASDKKRVITHTGSLAHYRTPFAKVMEDVNRTLFSWRIWMSMGWQDVRLRYKRTKLGPFWITLTTCIFIASIGFIFGHLFHSEKANYLPHLAGGYITWTFISSILNESTDVFNNSQRYILQINLPYTLYVMRMVFKHAITLFHNFLPVILISLWFGYEYQITHVFLLALGFLLVALCGLFYGTVFACFGARFRDMKPVIHSFVRLCFFLTPIMWTKEKFPKEYMFLVDYNPFYHLIEVIRRPLLGSYFTWINLAFSFAIMCVGALLMIFTLRRTRHRIAFWV